MTNTKFRKRALLSSVAMLLVALVALGSATFAWFSTQNQATASTITAGTTKGSDITLSETGAAGSFTHNLIFQAASAAGGNLTPVTTKDFSTWNYVEAKDNDSGYSETAYSAATAITAANLSPTYVKKTQLFIKSSVDQGIRITPTITGTTGTADKEFVRVALVPLATTSTNATGAWTGNKVFATDDEDFSNTTTGWNASTLTASDKDSIVNTITTFSAYDATKSDTYFSLGNATAGTIYGYDVYVWVEGTDLECKDSNSGTSASITFTVTGDAA